MTLFGIVYIWGMVYYHGRHSWKFDDLLIWPVILAIKAWKEIK